MLTGPAVLDSAWHDSPYAVISQAVKLPPLVPTDRFSVAVTLWGPLSTVREPSVVFPVVAFRITGSSVNVTERSFQFWKGWW